MSFWGSPMAARKKADDVFQGLLDKANQDLSQVPVRIERRGQSLYLLATLPPRPGSKSRKRKPHQQRWAVGVKANPRGLKRAIAEARKMGAQLDLKEFDWADWLDEDELSGLPFGRDAVVAFANHKRPMVKPSTWRQHWHYLLKAIPLDERISPEHAIALIEKHPVDSRARQQWLNGLSEFFEFFEVELNTEKLQATYHRPINLREIPNDQAIAWMRDSIENENWQYAFGLQAAYGLRNHEIFYIDPRSLKERGQPITVMDGKTGMRQVWPFHPEWWDEWRLWDYSNDGLS